MEEQFVRSTINQAIERRENRLKELKSTYPLNLETIGKIEHSIMTLIELEHNLRLCDCPDEAYKQD